MTISDVTNAPGSNYGFQYEDGHILDEIGPNVGAGFPILRRYVYGPDGDEPLVWYEGSGTSDRRYLVADERGSIVAVTDGAGAALALNSYDEYGIPGAGNVGRFQYTGQAWLAELGMYSYKARIYSPTMGRFLQPDPIGHAAGPNWYNYTNSDPVNNTDPMGLQGETKCKPHAADTKACEDPPIVVEHDRLPPDPLPPDRVFHPTFNPATPPTPSFILQPQHEIVVTARKPTRSFGQCALDAGRNNAAGLALDFIGGVAAFVPGGKGLVTAGAAAVGATAGTATLGLGVARRDPTTVMEGLTGHYLSSAAGLLDGAKGLAGYLPGVGQAAAIVSFGIDSYRALSDEGCL